MHWLARDKRNNALELKNGLIAFHHVVGAHDEKNLATVTIRLLDRAGVTAHVSFLLLLHHSLTSRVQVGHFTFDNAKNNATFMSELAILLNAHDIPFDALDNRIM